MARTSGGTGDCVWRGSRGPDYRGGQGLPATATGSWCATPTSDLCELILAEFTGHASWPTPVPPWPESTHFRNKQKTFRDVCRAKLQTRGQFLGVPLYPDGPLVGAVSHEEIERERPDRSGCLLRARTSLQGYLPQPHIYLLGSSHRASRRHRPDSHLLYAQGSASA